jgi:hypothetical protein
MTITTPDRSQLLLDRSREVHRLLRAGESNSEIAIAIGVTPPHVYEAALSPDARIVAELPTMWAAVGTVARLTGISKHHIFVAGRDGRISMDIWRGRRIVSLDEVREVLGGIN